MKIWRILSLIWRNSRKIKIIEYLNIRVQVIEETAIKPSLGRITGLLEWKSELKNQLDKLVGMHQSEVDKGRELNRKTLVQYQSHAIISTMESLKHHTRI